MSFNCIQVITAYNISGEDMESKICYMVEMGGAAAYEGRNNRMKGNVVELYLHLSIRGYGGLPGRVS
jgi:OTU domain-containing protein 5